MSSPSAPIAKPTTELPVDEIALGDIDPWIGDEREAIFAKLRDERPVAFMAEPEYVDEAGTQLIPPGPGFWAVTRYADVMMASRNPETFHSAPTTTIADIPAPMAEWLGSMINMDAPKHTKLRMIVNRGFTPRQVARLEDIVVATAQEIVADVAAKGECDFVAELSGKFPLLIICDMLGIPRSDAPRIFELTNTVLGVGDPDYANTMEELMAAGMELYQYGLDLAQQRESDPRDDIATALMHAEIEDEDGVHRLTPSELGSFFLLLVAAGNETTRTAISHGLVQMTRHADEKQRWLNDPEGIGATAVEEIVRWATPVIQFRRTASVETTIGDQAIAAGDKVVLYYNSANRDERQFDDPFRFDLGRTPNDHVGFGAGGPHFCLGANLARREIRVFFEELFRVLPDIEAAGEPAYLQSGFIHGIKRLPCRFTPQERPD